MLVECGRKKDALRPVQGLDCFELFGLVWHIAFQSESARVSMYLYLFALFGGVHPVGNIRKQKQLICVELHCMEDMY